MSATFLPALVFALASGGARAPGAWRPPELKVAAPPQVLKFEALREIAFSYLGTPYRMGGIGSPSIDCSGFTCRVYAEAGYAIPRVSRDQAKAGYKVSLKELEPGDLVFFVAEPGTTRITHVGMYIGERQMIHASSGSGRVVVVDFDRKWYQDRVVAARRFLPDPLNPSSTPPIGSVPTSSTSTSASGGGAGSVATRTSSTAPKLAKAKPARKRRGPWQPPKGSRSRESVEHTGSSILPITKRLPGRLARPSIGPRISWSDATSLAVRSAIITEQGAFGLTLVPEATYHWERYALLASIAVPIRIDKNQDVSVGRLDSFADWTRFIRQLSIGLPGADLEVRLDRLGDLSLGNAAVVDRLAPGITSSGVPGLSVVTTPLALVAGYRGEDFAFEGFVADIGDPKLAGVSAARRMLGGDLDLATVVPMLEARLGSWKAPDTPAPEVLAATPSTFDKATIHLVDKPGAAQTVLKAVLPVNMPTDDDYRALDMGVTVLGGAFTARLNMNLREDKGYTYGARCRLTNNLGPNTFGCSTSVATNVTTPAFKELMSEISDIRMDRPATQSELDYFKGYRIYGFQGRYETPAALLQQVATIWNYNLPENWLEQFVPSIEAVDLGSAQTALSTWLDTDRIAYVVVGDKATFGEEFAGLGLPIVEYDRHGNLLETP